MKGIVGVQNMGLRVRMSDFDRQIDQVETTMTIFSLRAPLAMEGPFRVKGVSWN